MTDIKVSVIMGVYNPPGREILRQAVESILTQSLTELEFIIYDDGSDEEKAEYIRELRELDKRIVLAGKKENHGLAFSLNTCLQMAKGKYVARMDADDVSKKDRLEKQFNFMENNPQYSWCGCNTELFDENGIWGERKMPEIPEKADYLRYSPYVHPTVMYRKDVLLMNRGYDDGEETLRCEDYEIFMRLRQKGYHGYNLQENLFCYRENENSYQKRTMHFRVNESKVRYRNFKKMGILWPRGWIYVLRPVMGGLLPPRMIAYLKRLESQKQI